ncbi:dimethylargininase [Nocardioides luteus]|uniref:N(G),N(G)-dimethylarginine dimethylaminohydrolase n=1 Tax=Nocardioides luteus TaxID=1844 RepID=A0ABQ5SZQ2_9ACTN|nr:dimethylargininase [Nocardioides luteus]MDR7310547.1 dimethylargininase [Nocardioides luteus]GGR42092.1 N(G),N(G)-dimethylarginine dimethylaminohydrolase [Nocardioides luteus]GLJ69672.1 N(G),N(G)-dimethylarginine dimethylaminohydrolase [Nocardioides luteus]
MHALVRRPSPRLADGLITHIERSAVDVDLAREQWATYVEAMRSTGWTTHEVDPLEDCPDSVFVEDTMVVFDDLAVISRPGAAERRPEITAAEEAVRERGYRIAHIEAPGTLDGGDVLKHDRTVWVGEGGRTNAEGITQLRALLEPLGAEVIAVPTSKVLHLKSAVTALPDGTVIGYEPLVDDPSVWGARFLPVPEEPGSHVVVLDERTLLMSSAAPRSRAMFEERGYTVVAVDISEFEKLEGCVTCLSVRLRAAQD